MSVSLTKFLMNDYSFEPLGDCALIVRLQEIISPALCRKISQIGSEISRANLLGVVETVPAYSTLAVHYEPWKISYDDLCSELNQLIHSGDTAQPKPRSPFKLPVSYDPEFGIDLEILASECGITADEVVKIHSGAVYTVAMIGFSPGFPYLLGLPPEIASPRLAAPRERVAAGSVGIGGIQTGIYPRESPGGWKIIGRTPAILFDPAQDVPSLLQPGDTVRFVPISKDEYEKMTVVQMSTES